MRDNGRRSQAAIARARSSASGSEQVRPAPRHQRRQALAALAPLGRPTL